MLFSLSPPHWFLVKLFKGKKKKVISATQTVSLVSSPVVGPNPSLRSRFSLGQFKAPSVLYEDICFKMAWYLPSVIFPTLLDRS